MPSYIENTIEARFKLTVRTYKPIINLHEFPVYFHTLDFMIEWLMKSSNAGMIEKIISIEEI